MADRIDESDDCRIEEHNRMGSHNEWTDDSRHNIRENKLERMGVFGRHTDRSLEAMVLLVNSRIYLWMML